MSTGPSRPYVSVKFSPVGRTYSFLIPELALDGTETPATVASPAPLAPGDAIVVQTADGRALGTVTRSVPELAARKCPPADSDLKVVRRATHEDIVTRLKQKQREACRQKQPAGFTPDRASR